MIVIIATSTLCRASIVAAAAIVNTSAECTGRSSYGWHDNLKISLGYNDMYIAPHAAVTAIPD